MTQLAVLIASFIVGTHRIILVPTILGSTRHAAVVYIHAVYVGSTVPAGVKNVFSINPLGWPICRSYWYLSDLEGIHLHCRLLNLMSKFRDGCGEVCAGFPLSHHRFPV